MIPVSIHELREIHLIMHKTISWLRLVNNMTSSGGDIETIPKAWALGDSSESTEVVNVNQNANAGADAKTAISFHHPTVLMTLAVISVFVLMAALVYAFGKIKSLKHRLAMAEHQSRRSVGPPIPLGPQNQPGHRNIYNQPV